MDSGTVLVFAVGFVFATQGELDWMPIINHDHQVRSTGGIISARRSGNGRTV
jgi:hypothetical protein